MEVSLNALESHSFKRGLLAFLFFLVFLNYGLLQDIYRPHNTDDPWVLSFAYNYMHYGTVRDETFVGIHIGDTEGIRFFRKTHALIYGSLLSAFGWSYDNAQWISTLLVFGAAGLWFLILKRMGFDNSQRTVFLALYFLLEFSFMAANTLRQEALLMFFQAGTFLLFLNKRFVLAGLVTGIALETHPIALLNLAYPAAWFLTQRIRQQNPSEGTTSPENIRPALGGFLTGCLAGGIYYWLLHRNDLAGVTGFLFGHTGTAGLDTYPWLGALGNYFFMSKYYRHLPELFLILFALFVFIKQEIYREKENILFLFAFAILVMLSFLRHIFFYTLLIYPCFLFIIVLAFSRMKRTGLLLAFVLGLMIPQYGLIYIKNHAWDRESYVAHIRELVPEDNVPVVGSTPSWFAFMDRKNFKAACFPKERFAQLNYPRFYLVQDRFIESRKSYRTLLDYIGKHYEARTLREERNNGYPLVLEEMIRIPDKAPMAEIR